MLPNFLIAGTIKGGTSSLWSYLYNHPDIFFAEEKELKYFTTQRYKKGIDWYKKQFKNYKWEKIIGEATPNYLNKEQVPARIYKIIPDAKLLFLLRNPIDRAYSHYWMKIRKAEETRSFEKAVKEELNYLNNKSRYRCIPYISIGFYYQHIKRYLEYFDRKKIHIIIFEDFVKEPLKTIKSIYNFLEIRDEYIPSNIGEVVYPSLKSGFSLRSRLILYLIYYFRYPLRIVNSHLTSMFDKFYISLNKNLINLNIKINTIPGKIPNMNNDTRNLLRKIFQQENQKLQDFLQHDLSNWK